MLEAFTQRRQAMLEHLTSIDCFQTITPYGAFYIFVNIGATGLTSLDFCQKLLETQHVAAIPGVAFGADDCIRFSYATDMTSIEKGMKRLVKFIQSL
jgi:aspartate aminotransferase